MKYDIYILINDGWRDISLEPGTDHADTGLKRGLDQKTNKEEKKKLIKRKKQIKSITNKKEQDKKNTRGMY